MNQPLVELTNSELQQRSLDYLCIVRFIETSKAGYPILVKFAEVADIYAKGDAGKNKLTHLAAFGKSEKSMKAAHLLLEELRVGSFKYTLFAAGKVQNEKGRLINMLACWSDAIQLGDTRAHCYTTMDNPHIKPPSGMGLTISLLDPLKDDPVVDERWRLPCRHVEGFIERGPFDEVTPQARIEAAAVRRCAHLCPLFEPEKFERIMEVTEPKRYW